MCLDYKIEQFIINSIASEQANKYYLVSRGNQYQYSKVGARTFASNRMDSRTISCPITYFHSDLSVIYYGNFIKYPCILYLQLIMRKAHIQQSHLQHDQLIINYKQNEEAVIDSFLPVWNQVWTRFENDICSYIIPSITSMQDQLQGSQQVTHQPQMKMSYKTSSPSFSFAYSTRQLRRVIIMHSNLQVFPAIRKQITRIFYRIANAFVAHALTIDPSNLFQSVIQGYQRAENKLSVLIGCLNMVLNKFITRKGIEDQIYLIINKQLVHHSLYESYVNSCLGAIQSLRNECLQIRQLTPDYKNASFPSHNNSIIEDIKLLNKLKIFPYLEYLERSKKYYCQIQPQIPKNMWMFSAICSLVCCQKLLYNVISPDEQQLENAKRILKNQTWRPIEQESMIKVLCKQVIQELYDDMIEYVDFLLQLQSQSSFHHQHLTLQEKRQMLKYLWQLTKIFQKYLAADKKPRNSINLQKKSNQNTLPSVRLLNRILLIVSDVKKLIRPDINSQGYNNKSTGSLYKLINFKDHVFSIVAQCFENESKFLNAITIKMEESISTEEESYYQKLCSIILSPFYKFPGEDGHRDVINLSSQMVDQSDQQNRTLENRCSYQLFKIAPSKPQFLMKFQQQFSNYVLPFKDHDLDLTEQENFIKIINKEGGHGLSKNIQRMLHDVWRNGKMIYYSIKNMSCRILCHDWPQFKESKYKLADSLLEVRADFQIAFLSEQQHEKKKLKWIQQCGKIKMTIGGTQSVFSQLQASIVILLSRSYRPIKQKQFKEVLQYKDNDMQNILEQLALKQIIIYNREAENFELNYENKTNYYYEKKQNLATRSYKKYIQKDYTISIQAMIARILKRRKSVQKTDLSRLLNAEIRLDNHQATVEEINTCIERLQARNIISIEKTRGIIKYIQ